MLESKKLEIGHATAAPSLWRNARVATLDPNMAGLDILEDGAVLVHDGRIAWIGNAEALTTDMVQDPMVHDVGAAAFGAFGRPSRVSRG